MTHPEGRDSITGQFVTDEYVEEHPDTTEIEQIPDLDTNCGVVPVVIPAPEA